MVDEIYEEKMDSILGAIDSPVDIGADGRTDSPGHLALYGITTCMDCKSKLIIASNLVKVS